MRNIKITIEYDGTNYHGWQRQKNTSETVQEKLEEALTTINKKPVDVQGASRTDAGVHAMGQAANFFIDVSIPVERIPPALNRLLPEDIRCVKAEAVPVDFHARHDAQGKKYLYRIYNQGIPSVFIRNYVYYFKKKLDPVIMQQAARSLEGTHDFTSFRAADCTAKTTVRTIQSIEVIDKSPEIWVEVKGDGFLYNMVRIIIGTLIEVSLGKIRVKEVAEILAAKDRRLAGFTAPARGLTLVEVYYEKNCLTKEG